MNAVELHDVAVEAGGRALLGPISLAAAERAFVLVVGPSGAGKTTLLRVIAGLARPVRGRVGLFGALASEGRKLVIPPERRDVGFLFQGGALWPHFSVRRTLDFVLRCRGVPRAERARRVVELIEWVELAGFADRRPAELSGGEAQRLALARAIACEPRILLLDEPLGPLDAPLRRGLIERLAELHSRLGTTTFYVSHDPAEVRHLATDVLTLERGRPAAPTAPEPAAGTLRA